ncbi:MAG: YlmC/YmxH family sporulation protein [Ammonifex sp.]|jgi:YlmC/YmxH family sporulation protein|nr:MAG: YlmC/YmxH family sporulation protein [Ammonifex sp.]
MLKISELRMREVINVIDGRRLGLIKDIDIDTDNGKIQALVLPGPSRILGFFGKEEELIIPWENIVRIGMDVVLVEAHAENYARYSYRR